MAIVHHAKKLGFFHCLLHLVWNVDLEADYHWPDLSCIEDPINAIYMAKNADVWWREMLFEGRQRHHALGPRFVWLHSLEKFILAYSKKKCSTLRYLAARITNRIILLEFPRHWCFRNYWVNYAMFGSKVWEFLCETGEVRMALTTLDAFLPTVRHRVVDHLAPN